MSWTPITREDLERLLAAELRECPEVLRQQFQAARVPPEKWQQSPWGDEGGGFWVVAVLDRRVLWYNDIEEGFNVSTFSKRGVIPQDQYWCNQDPLKWALPQLFGSPGFRLGPPQGVSK